MTQTNINDTQIFTWIQGELFDYPEGYEFLGISGICRRARTEGSATCWT